MVELNGALSNPQAVLELPALRKKIQKLLERPLRPSPDPAKLRIGIVASTVYNVLLEAGKPMQAREIYDLCRTELGDQVKWNNVKGHLWANSRTKTSKYMQLKRGRYIVRPTAN